MLRFTKNKLVIKFSKINGTVYININKDHFILDDVSDEFEIYLIKSGLTKMQRSTIIRLLFDDDILHDEIINNDGNLIMI